MASDHTVTQGGVLSTVPLHFSVTRIESFRMWLGIRLLGVVGVIIGTSVSVELIDPDDIEVDQAGA